MRLEVKELTKMYGPKAGLDSFSAVFDEGIYGILGPNGAGKSTFMSLLTDNIRRDSGCILVDGVECLKMGKEDRRLLGYMPQQQGLYDRMTGRMFLRYMAELKGLPRKESLPVEEELLERLNLADAADKKLGGYSGGMKQRILLAQAMLGNPKILILDEPTSGLDPMERVRLRELLGSLRREKIILYSTHVISDIEEIAEKVVLLYKGKKILESGVQALLEENDGMTLEHICVTYFEQSL